MAAAAVLRSQDLFRQNNRFNCGSSKPSPKSGRSRRRKQSPSGFESKGKAVESGRDQAVKVSKSPAKELVMGHVKILKRGEVLSTSTSVTTEVRKLGFGGGDAGDLMLCSTNPIGPDPDMVRNQIKVAESKVVDGIYAGPVSFFASPPPSSLPFPAFFKKEKKNDLATSDLHRLLRLDLVQI